MMKETNGETAGEAAATLWTLWKEQRTIEALPSDQRPATIDEGWAIQRALDRHAGAHAGWKVAATSPAGQRAIGADGPLVGRLYDHTIVTAGSVLAARPLSMKVAEAEFAFAMAGDLDLGDGPLTRQCLLDAIGTLHPAIEVPDSRFDDYTAVGLASLVADALCAAHLVVGEPMGDWNAVALPDIRVTMYRNGVEVSAGSGADVLGEPVDAMMWIAGELARLGHTLRAGDIVTTGACTPPNPIAPGGHLTADFGALGRVDVDFS